MLRGVPGRAALLLTMLSFCVCLPARAGRSFPGDDAYVDTAERLWRPQMQRRLQQAAGCIPFVQTGCPAAFPNPSCCVAGPDGPSRCAPLLAPGGPGCATARFCCE